MKIDEMAGKKVYVKENFTYDVDNDIFKPTHFKKGEEHTIIFNNENTVAILGCIFSLDREKDKHPSFYENFYTLKDIRKEKLNKLNIKS